MFAALRQSHPWISRLLLVTLAMGWLSASAQLCLMGEGSDDVRLDAVHCNDNDSHACCEGGEDSSEGNPAVGCQGMDMLSSPLLDIAGAGLDPWDLAHPVDLSEPVVAAPSLQKRAVVLPAFASTPETHSALRFRTLRI